MKKVRKIEVPEKHNIRKLRVAAYCRVSTKYESQKSSIELQKSYYENYIKEQPDWVFAGVYTYYGSRVRIDQRIEFKKMIRKAMKGKIDLIITKSISRFSGNTVDMLQTIRALKEKGVTVWFEKEDVRSTDDNIEFVITIHTMLVQEEIRNMSENIQWGFQRIFEQGITLNNYKYFYGYDVVDGELVINEQQAEVVRNIFDWYLKGMSLGQIKHKLEESKIKTASGNDIWNKSVIQEMLCNEKYKGDSLLQKTVTEDFMTGKKVKNVGHRNQYYVKGSHAAIVSEEIFDKVQEEMRKRARMIYKGDGTVEAVGNKYNGKYSLGNLLVCGDCGASYRRRTGRGKVVWRCATRIEKGKNECTLSPTINEVWLKEQLSKPICDGTYDDEVVKKRWIELKFVMDTF